ncbi:MAG: hypothetical protein BWK73_28125 [Thiothrix lacustris]|uniref:DUF4426 domain-containing protein n=1 Tax=Thiothrix lacustris TaxID=525917 RepID=A0A1Y1QJV5_9GAMM|nr:MAG: hypothetical protein BWK73_28125 [Thiothrix lacustris]
MFNHVNKLILGGLLAVSACTSVAGNYSKANFVTATGSNTSVAFESLRVEADKKGGNTLVKGQIRRIGREPIHFGYVDYAVLNAQGTVRESGFVGHSSAIRIRNIYRPSLFDIHLKQPLASGEKVRLSYQTGSH